METLHFILAAYGMTFIIVYGKIFEDIRPSKDYTKKWNTLWNCPLCMGFWVGVFLSLLSPYTELFSFERSFVNAFLLGCLSIGLFAGWLDDQMSEWSFLLEVSPERLCGRSIN